MGKFKAPENLADLSIEDLSAAVTEAQTAYAAYADIADADLDDEQAADVVAIAEFVTGASHELEAREAAAAERSESLAAARQALAVRPAVDEDDTDADAEDGTEGDIPGADEDKDKDKDKGSAATQTAAVRRTSFAARAAKSTPAGRRKDSVPAGPRASLVAAADVRGVPAGKEYSNLSDAAEAILSRLNSLPKSFTPKTYIRHGALAINLPEGEFSQSNFGGRDSEMLMQAGNESRLKGGSLVAAGGWGAPSEMSLDFCKQESIGDLLTIPEVTLNRPGVQYTKGPTFADVFNSATGFWDMDETTAEAGLELKTSYRPEVPDFEEERLDAVGVMMEAGLLLRQGWPELVQRYADLGLTAHQFKMAMKTIRLIEKFTGNAKSVTSGFGNVTDVLSVLELVATGERQKNAMAINQTLEAIVPFWLMAAIRAALANRHGMDFLAVTDTQINAWFAARNIKVQWINAYQNLELDANGIATAYPETFEVIMYPAGTYVRGVAPVITLDTIYDSVNLKRNDYVHLFVEQGMLVTNPCGEGQRLELPLNVNGRMAAHDITKSFNGTAPVAP